MYFKSTFSIVFAVGVFIVSPVYAETDAQLLTKGQWHDPATGLVWMRCSVGQKWTGKACTGEPTKFTWQKALDVVAALSWSGGLAGRTDWRVPAIEELSTLRKCSKGWRRETEDDKTTVEGQVATEGNIATEELPNGQSVPSSCAEGSSSPTLNTATFPNTKSVGYWTSTPDATLRSYAKVVLFSSGTVGSGDKSYDGYVRLVRTGQ